MYNRRYGQRRPLPTVPQNYSGNAYYRVRPPFAEMQASPPPSHQAAENADASIIEAPPSHDCPYCEQNEAPPVCEEDDAPSSLPNDRNKPSLPFSFAGKLFPNGLGSEELLILAVMLITSQNNNEDNDIFLFLVLLLFI